MYDKNAEVEISWGLFHKVNKLFQVTGKPHNSRLKQDVRANRTFTWEQLKLEVLVFFHFWFHLPIPFWNQEPKIIIVHIDTLGAYILWKWISTRAN